MPFYEFEGKKPVIGSGSFIHPEAVVIGDVTIGEGCYIAPGAVLRGDWGSISVGKGCNIQDNCILHAGPDGKTILDDECHIGHGSIIHEATLGHHVLVGMGAIVQDRAHIGDGCVIGAGCVVLSDSQVPPKKLVVGVPGKVVSEVSEELKKLTWFGTRHYQALPGRYQKTFREIPLEEMA